MDYPRQCRFCGYPMEDGGVMMDHLNDHDIVPRVIEMVVGIATEPIERR